MHRATRLASIALGGAETASADDAAWVDAVCERDPFLGELSGEGIRDAFDPWS